MAATWSHLVFCYHLSPSWPAPWLLVFKPVSVPARWCHWVDCGAAAWGHFCGRIVRAVHRHPLAFQWMPGKPVRYTYMCVTHVHVCGTQALHPNRWATATLSASSDSLSPTAVIGGAWSQSPAWGEETARSLALSTSHEVLERMRDRWFSAIRPSQAFRMWCNSAAGLDELDRLVHMDTVDSMNLSSTVWMLSGKMDCWSWSVDAADAKKAEGASIWTLCMPKPPSRTGSVACIHWSSFKSTFKIVVRPARSVLSNWLSSGLSAHSKLKFREGTAV